MGQKTSYLKQLGLEIGKVRLRKKISQEELAGESLIDRTYLARIELGKANPTVKILYKICRCLHIKIHELLKDI